MLMKAWLSALQRQMVRGTRNVAGLQARRRDRKADTSSGSEQLEERSLLTALVINSQNFQDFSRQDEGIRLENSDLTGFDSLVIESVAFGGIDTPAIDIDLSGINLNAIAIENVDFADYEDAGIEINLDNVTGLDTLAIEDARVTGSQVGVQITLSGGTDVEALTVDDSQLSGLAIIAGAGTEIGHTGITENRLVGNLNLQGGVEGLLLDFDAARADNIFIVDNDRVSSQTKDALLVKLNDAPQDGLNIRGNTLGASAPIDIEFIVDGDTFSQPFRFRNPAQNGELVSRIFMDVEPSLLEFDEDPATGKPFTALNGTDLTTGLAGAVTTATTLELTFNEQDPESDEFAPGEEIVWEIDLDIAGGIDAPINGADLIGSTLTFEFNDGKVITGTMIGIPGSSDASQFSQTAGDEGANGISVIAVSSPISGLVIEDNIVSGTPGSSVLIDTKDRSDIVGSIRNNEFTSSGSDGVVFNLEDGNFQGGITGNSISNHDGDGLIFNPSVTRSGRVERVFAGPNNSIGIESTFHQLETGDIVILQGLLDDDFSQIYPANGQFRVAKLDNNEFLLRGLTDSDPDPQFSDGVYDGGGTWYEPEIDADGFARGLVQLDLQSELPGGFVQAASNTDPIVIQSNSHGLANGDLIRISNVAGNSAANGIRQVTILDENRFQLSDANGDSVAGNGDFDVDAGLGTWRGNVITGLSELRDEIVVLAPSHGLKSGDRVRVTGVQGDTLLDQPHSANGTHVIRRIDDDSFRLVGVESNGDYTDGGTYQPIRQETTTGDFVEQAISGNSFTSNNGAGVRVGLTTGTVFRADLTSNQFADNLSPGLDILSQSYGLGTGLPLDPTDPSAVPAPQDVSFDVNVGSENLEDGNVFDRNRDAGIRIVARDSGTGSFEIRNNRIINTQDAGDSIYQGDGIHVRLDGDDARAEAASILSESIIDSNIVGVDAEGNEGRGTVFSMLGRARIQDLEYANNEVVRNGDDGFNFDRSGDARLNNVRVTKNTFEDNNGDGADFNAENTTRDLLDFRFDENEITNNEHYGIRITVLADARIEVDLENNTIDNNGEGGNGFHPNDGLGNQGVSGGIGFFAFQNVEIRMDMTGNRVVNNRGDGLSIDAENFFDQLRVTGDWTGNEFNDNDLSGVRNNGIAFGTFSWTGNEFNDNGEDGVRSVTLYDNDDFFNRRIGGTEIDIVATANTFNTNGSNGLHLGQSVSALLGDGSEARQNEFSFNGEDGLKITQGAGEELFLDDRRRTIIGHRNLFINNIDDGIDIGDDFKTEGSLLAHGDEVVTQTDIRFSDITVRRNLGDGIEYLVDPLPAIPRKVGSQQDDNGYYVFARSSLTVRDSSIRLNEGRGIDILNRLEEDSFINITNNDIINNGLSGVYVVNTASPLQLQDGPSDVLVQELNTTYTVEQIDDTDLVVSTLSAQPHVEIRIEENEIESNGDETQTSTVPINLSIVTNDATGVTDPDWTHETTQIPGTLGGVVFRVGSVEAPLGYDVVNTFSELNDFGGIDATVIKNTFNGNIGSEVYFDNFTSVVSPQSVGQFHTSHDPCFNAAAWNGSRDAISRFDLVFVENTGNSLDVINGWAFQDNWESYFKSRTSDSTAPDDNHNNGNSPPDRGPHSPSNDGARRRRNSTRTLGWTIFDSWQLGQLPVNWPGPCGDWAFDGEGTSTWRVESSVQDEGFSVDETFGESSFDTIIPLSDRAGWFGEEHYQWDTGFTPFSLDPGDVFNLVDSDDIIDPDEFEENDHFVSASYLGTMGLPFSVNDETSNGILSIEQKADRDYYAFDITDVGALQSTIEAANSATTLELRAYWFDPDSEAEERQIGTTAFAFPGQTSTLTANISGTSPLNSTERDLFNFLSVPANDSARIILEVRGAELSNVDFRGGGTPYIFGTADNYLLDIDAPGDGPSGSSLPGGGSGGDNSGGGSGGGGDVNLPGDPTADIENVVPSPRSTGVPQIGITFNEDVTNVDITDFRLTLDDTVIDISDRTVVEIDPMTYSLDLTGVTSEEGTYRLLLRRSDIIDIDGNLLVSNASETWIVDAGVNSTDDFPDSEVGDGQASDDDGLSSLRAAVQEANAIPGEDLIRLEAGTYNLFSDTHFELDSLEGDLNVTDDLRIVGAGAGVTIIDGNAFDRIFTVAPNVTLTLDGITLRNGEAHDGGAIFNEGTLNLVDSNIVESRAFNQGGGIYNLGSLDLDGSSVVFNSAGSRGGGIFNAGDLKALNTTIAENTSVSRGGGIFNEGTVDLNSVTIAKNDSGARGGGIANENPQITDIDEAMRFGNTLIADNTSDFLSPDSGNVYAPDVDTTPSTPTFTTIDSRGFNLVGYLDTHVERIAEGYLSTDILGGTGDEDADPAIDAKLANLVQANGTGLNGTYRINLKSGSPAVDAGNDNFFPDAAVNRDQVDQPRFLDGNLDSERQIDIGARERFINRPVAAFTIQSTPAAVDERVTFDATLSSHTLTDFRIVSWEWDFDYDGANFDVDATGEVVGNRFAAAGTFQVALRVTDNNEPAKTAIRVQTVVIGVAPDSPIPQRPFRVVSDTTPTLQWTGGAADFQIQIRRLEEDGTTTLILDENDIQQNEFTIPTSRKLDAGGRYEYRVRGRNGAGFGDWSAYRFFRIRTITVSHPLTKEPDLTPLIQWTGVPNTLRYELFVKDTRNNVEVYRISNLPGTVAEGERATEFELPDTLPVGDYLVRVIAYDRDDQPGDKSAPRRFSIVAPEGLLPDELTVDSTPLLRWTKVNTPFYEVEVRDRTNDNLVFADNGIDGTSIESINLADGDYYFRVRAVKANGEVGHWSERHNFTVDSQHSLVPLSPTGPIVDRTPFFEWEGVGGVGRYEFVLQQRVNGRYTRILREDNLTSPEYQLEDADRLSAGNYRWRVRWVNADGQDGTYRSTEFKVVRPRIQDPTDGSTVNTSLPRIRWSGSSVMVEYELRVDNVDLNINNVIRETGLTSKTYRPDEPLANWQFRARVRGMDEDGNVSEWSEISLFTVDGAVGLAPLIVAPNGGAVVGQSPAFRWRTVNSAFTYNILIKEVRANGQPLVLEVNGITAQQVAIQTHNLQETLPSQRSYRVWVQAVDAAGNPGPFSAPGNFRTASSRDIAAPLALDVPVDTTSNESSVVATLGEQITIHPALPAEGYVQQPVVELNAKERVAVPTTQDEGDVDSVMSSWATDWHVESTDDVESTDVLEQVIDPPVEDASTESQPLDKRLLFAAGLPMLFGRKRRDERKRSDRE